VWPVVRRVLLAHHRETERGVEGQVLRLGNLEKRRYVIGRGQRIMGSSYMAAAKVAANRSRSEDWASRGDSSTATTLGGGYLTGLTQISAFGTGRW
jgi:hypothetical protein